MKGNKSTREADLAPKGLNLEAGKPFSRELFRRDRDQIMASYLGKGFLLANFKSEVRLRADEPHQLELIYDINEGPQANTGAVQAIGALHTDLELILRNAELKSGQPLSATGLIVGQSHLHILGVFDWVSIATRRPVGDTSEPDVLVKVHEGKRNSITYGVGFEAIDRGDNVPSNTVAVPGLPLVGLPVRIETSEEPIGSYIGFNRIGVCDRARLVAK